MRSVEIVDVSASTGVGTAWESTAGESTRTTCTRLTASCLVDAHHYGVELGFKLLLFGLELLSWGFV
jgi:hypothetical protein